MGYQFVDQYTLLHFAVGIVVYFWGLDFWVWTLIHILFEYTENTTHGMWFINNYVTWWPGGKSHADHWVNRTGDVLAGCLGWLLAKTIDQIGKSSEDHRRV
jgi:hypothetical protein